MWYFWQQELNISTIADPRYWTNLLLILCFFVADAGQAEGANNWPVQEPGDEPQWTQARPHLRGKVHARLRTYCRIPAKNFFFVRTIFLAEKSVYVSRCFAKMLTEGFLRDVLIGDKNSKSCRGKQNTTNFATHILKIFSSLSGSVCVSTDGREGKWEGDVCWGDNVTVCCWQWRWFLILK